MTKKNQDSCPDRLSPAEIWTADNDVRYVPAGAVADFCGLAHESRYAWVLATKDLSGKTILDFGCGSGYGAQLLGSRAAVVHGLDYSKQAIIYAEAHYKPKNVTFYQADAMSFQEVSSVLTLQAYDLITSFDVIEHITAYRDYLANIAALLRNDGTLIIGSPNRLQTLNWNRTWNPYHKQEFGPRQFRELLLDYFEEVELLSQDFRDPAKREAARLSNFGTDKPLPVLSLRQPDIVFTSEPPIQALDQAFGLMAVCKRVRGPQAASASKRVKVLLIEPSYGYREALPWIPIGKGFLAALLRRAGFEVQIIDNALQAYENNILLSRITAFEPDIIGTGGMTLQMSDTKKSPDW